MSMITDVESSRMTVDSTMSDDSLSSRHSLLSNQSTRSHGEDFIINLAGFSL